MEKHDVIHKPEVHNVLQRRQKKTEPRLQIPCSENLRKFECVAPEIYG